MFFLHVKLKGRWDEVKSVRNAEMVAGGNKRNASRYRAYYLNNALGKNKQIVLYIYYGIIDKGTVSKT